MSSLLIESAWHSCWSWNCRPSFRDVGNTVVSITLLPLRRCFVVPAALPVSVDNFLMCLNYCRYKSPLLCWRKLTNRSGWQLLSLLLLMHWPAPACILNVPLMRVRLRVSSLGWWAISEEHPGFSSVSSDQTTAASSATTLWVFIPQRELCFWGHAQACGTTGNGDNFKLFLLLLN